MDILYVVFLGGYIAFLLVSVWIVARICIIEDKLGRKLLWKDLKTRPWKNIKE